MSTYGAWKALQAGDRVAVIAPGFGPKPKDIEGARHYLESLGLVPVIPDDILGEDLLSSNVHTIRQRHLHDAIYDDSICAVWCMKGGYGSAELLPELLHQPKPSRSKLFIGFSDNTALHLFLNQRWGWHSLHAPVLWQIVNGHVDETSTKTLEDVIFGRTITQTFTMDALNHAAETNDNITGPIIGGNMMLVQTTLATPWQPNSDGHILFFEDVEEVAYRIARMLVHFGHAGLFSHAHAVLFGDFTFDHKPEEQEKIEAVLQQFSNNTAVPCYRVRGIGHHSRHYPLPMGKTVSIYDKKLHCDSGILEKVA